MLKYKICVVGAKDVGKTSLIRRYCEGTFYEESQTTIGVSFKRKIILYRDKSVELTIWDLGGEEKYRKLFPQYIKGAAGAMLLFDINNIDSFSDLDKWMKIIEEHGEESICKMLIGTKMDLKNRDVFTKDAKSYHKKYGFCGNYVETSSKDEINVNKAFQTAAAEIIAHKMKGCNNCGEIIPINLKICRYCGEDV